MATPFRSTRGRVLVVGALTALLAVALLGTQISASSAAPAQKARVATIYIKDSGKSLFFQGPKTVRSGSLLRIKNLTSGSQVGPHTFSLADPKTFPRTRPARRACFSPRHICLAIAKWHGFRPPNTITVNPAKAGKAGWDTEGNATSKKGDSWFAGGKRGRSFQQVVSAKPGTVLHYVCAIHPFMNGSIRVVGSR